MKKSRIIIALLVLLGAASLAEAQIVVSSTTASTHREKPKSGREKGWVIRPEVEFGTGSHFDGGVGIYGTAAYQLNSYFAFGGGLGYLYDFIYDDPRVTSRPQVIPVFANARAYFIDRKWSPFFDLKLGYLIPLSSRIYEIYDGYYYIDTETIRGWYFDPTLGVQFKGFDFGIFARIYNLYRKWEHYDNDGNYNNGSEHYLQGSFGVSAAYNFQLKKK